MIMVLDLSVLGRARFPHCFGLVDVTSDFSKLCEDESVAVGANYYMVHGLILWSVRKEEKHNLYDQFVYYKSIKVLVQGFSVSL